MEIAAKDDLRNRISPRLYDFYKRNTLPDDQTVEGVVSWYKYHYQKDYCQSQLGYTCQRPAASMYGSDGTGIQQLNIDLTCVQIVKILFYLYDYRFQSIIYNFILAYRGCFSESHVLSKNAIPAYESKLFMKIGFCIQVCIGRSSDPTATPKFIGLSVSA